MPRLEQFCLRAAGISGLLAICFGAFGAHGLQHMTASLPPDRAAMLLDWLETGARYQLLHAAALLALAGIAPRLTSAAAPWIARAIFFGSLIFSATLYAMALGGPPWLGAVTPIGGVLMLLGWGLLLFA